MRAVIKVESDYDPRVVSSAGCVGLMQLTPETARAMGVTDIWDPRQNIMGGSRYLQVLARRFCRTPARGAGRGSCARPRSWCRSSPGITPARARWTSTGACRPTRPRAPTCKACCTRYEEFRHKEGASAAAGTVAVTTGKP